MKRVGRFLAGVVLALALQVPAAGSTADTPPPAVDASQLARVLQEQRGEVVLVNFWATWCRACLKEIPALLDLERRFRDRGFVLMFVSLDEPADYAGVVAPFLGKWFPGLQTYRRATPEMDGLVSVLDPAWNEVLPTSYVLDRGGKLRARIQGGKPVEDFVAAILPWLDAPGAAGPGGVP